jgi:UPF0176 protein
MSVVVAALYKFVKLPDFAEKQHQVRSHCEDVGIKGTILLAAEGINGTIAGTRQSIDSVLTFLRADPRLADLEHKESNADTPPFDRLKVRLKKEIVTLGLPEINPCDRVGTYVNPQDWNQLISDPEVTVIDTRNNFEVKIGTFEKAQNPQTESFRDFPEYVEQNLNPEKHKKVALKSHSIHAPARIQRSLSPQRRHPQIPRRNPWRKKLMVRRMFRLRPTRRR